jgi:sarcosine oxidase
MADFDIVVIGAGAMGGAALYHLARRGVRVVGIERFEPGHDRGSSHGETRVIRLGYYEHPSYVPLLRDAQVKWRELEQAAGRQLMHVTGIIEIGRPDGVLIEGTLAASRQHGLPHDVLDAGEVMRRFPAFRIPDDFIGVFQPDGGYIETEAAVKTHAALAVAAGATLRTGETVQSIEPHAGGVRVTTDRGAIEAKTAIAAAGAWMTKLFPSLPLRATRQVMAWFTPREPHLFEEGRFPVFMLDGAHGIHYGFPLRAEGLKISKHFHQDQTIDPDTIDRKVSTGDEAAIRAACADNLPAANGKLLAAKTCIYTMTPDGDFLIDRLPGAPNVIIASPCSGHGFKFAPVIGEILADLATSKKPAHDLSRFSLGRWS